MEKEKEKGLHDGHRDRLRDKYVQHGIDVLAPHEILEMILFYAIPRRDTNPLAHHLLAAFDGRLDKVFDARIEDLEAVEGVGHNAAVLISLFSQVSRRVQQEHMADIRFVNSFSEAADMMAPYFIGLHEEAVVMLALDGKKKLLCCRQFSEGNFSNSFLNPRSFLDSVSSSGASFVFLAHNHPSGNAMPSSKDVETTRELKQLLASVGIMLADHFIFADGDYVSMAQTKSFTFMSESGAVFCDPQCDIIKKRSE